MIRRLLPALVCFTLLAQGASAHLIGKPPGPPQSIALWDNVSGPVSAKFVVKDTESDAIRFGMYPDGDSRNRAFVPSQHRESQHGESEHGDSGHGDSEHGDSEHGDSGHGDSEHGDSDHGDSDHCPVPEPAIAWLLGLSALAVLSGRRIRST